MKSSEIRQSFLDYFKSHGHRLVPSSSLIPIDDPTLLFTNAGMNQFKLVFTGAEKRPYTRAASSQKCIRAGGKHNDLESVGQTARHHTFFEMLGNFSFGDYFKAEAIEFAWEYVTKVIGLPKDKLWATVFRDDDEAFALWEKIVPELRGRVLRFDEKENYWSMGETGPCGPCSELHFDRGEKYGTGPDERVNGEGDRFVEIWNLVFMQFERDANGNVTALPKPSIDTGAGLERITCVLQNGATNYDTDVFMPIIDSIESLTHRKYVAGPEGTSFRVIADHIRALTFAFSDGAAPSNEGRGYVLRRILRRAARHGRLLGLHEPFIYRLTDTVREAMGSAYPELNARAVHVAELIRAEEERFNETLDTGLDLFDRAVSKVIASGGDTIPGDEVFKLCDTYGFPPDLTEIMARERNLKVDTDGFEKLMREQQQRSKKDYESRGVSFEGVALDESMTCEFCGYDDNFSYESKITDVKPLKDGLQAVILDSTPFYAESGGQVGDRGRITADGLEFEVADTKKEGAAIVHIGRSIKGDVGAFVGKRVKASVDGDLQKATQRNHTATHLLHRALREVLGEHVQQAGSLVEPTRMRFDFSHFRAVTKEELAEIERRVNEAVLHNLPVRWRVMPLEDAKKAGAMALFGEKYGENVRMVEVEGFSRELCGGTHVKSTGEIGLFVITQESAIAAGMRRMEAVTGMNAYQLASEYRGNVERVAQILKATPVEIAERVDSLTKKIKDQQKELEKFQQAHGDERIKANLGKAKQVGEVYYVVDQVRDRQEAQQYLDNVKNDQRKIVVAMKQDSNYFVAASTAAAKGGISAMKVMQGLNSRFNGRGGGKDTFAQGGSKDEFSLADIEKAISETL